MEVWPSFCANCGQRVDRQDKFCRNCGVAVPQQPFESAGTMARPAFRDDAARGLDASAAGGAAACEGIAAG